MDVQPGSSVLVFGAGAVGLSAVMAAKVAGAATIVAVDLHSHRRDLALELGATHVIDGADGDVVEQIHGITAGGAQYAFDTTGIPAVILGALVSLRLGAVCGLVGVQTGPLVLDGLAAVGKTIMNILEGAADPRIFFRE
ncbi:MAG: zinc-binding dehydrogenase [Ilumatobacteraceae bacterium]